MTPNREELSTRTPPSRPGHAGGAGSYDHRSFSTLRRPSRRCPRSRPSRSHRGTRGRIPDRPGLVVFQIARPGGLAVLPHLAFEPACRNAVRVRDPRLLVRCAGHARDHAHLAPGQLVRDESALEVREPGERAVNPREILELARGQPRTLAGVVGQARVAEALVSLGGEQARGDGREDTAQRPTEAARAARRSSAEAPGASPGSAESGPSPRSIPSFSRLGCASRRRCATTDPTRKKNESKGQDVRFGARSFKQVVAAISRTKARWRACPFPP